MRKTLIALAFCLGTTNAALADGAFAIGGTNSVSFGIAVNYPNADAAAVAALRQCGYGNCRVIRTFRNACVAVVADDYAKWWSTVSTSLNDAIRTSMRNCVNNGRGMCDLLRVNNHCDNS